MSRFKGRLGDRLPRAASAFLVLWGLGLWTLDALGVPWTRASVSLAVLVALGGAWVVGVGAGAGRRGERDRPADEPRLFQSLEVLGLWGVLAIFAVGTFLGWNVMSDYVFHWGVKAERFALAGGIDHDFLTRPWNAHVHPDYPHLLPSLYASSMIWTGPESWSTDSWPRVAWVPILGFGLFLLACRRLARGVIEREPERLLALGAVAGGCLAFAMKPMLAGGGDLFVALAITLGAALLAEPADHDTDRDVAWIAALAAAAKLEGMVAAAGLVALHLLRRRATARGLPEQLLAGLRCAGPTAAVVGFWLAGVLRHDLFLESNTGGLDLGRLGTVISGLGSELLDPLWHGLPLVLLGLPILLLDRRLRIPATLIAVQGAFYVYVYLAGPVDTELWIQTSATRLYFHLAPAVALLLVGRFARERAGLSP